MANTTYGGNPYGANPSGNNPYGTNPYGSNLDYGSSDPRKIAAQQRRQNASQYAQGTQQAQNTQDYLGGIENPLAQGQGGYNASEMSQIQMTPEQQQQIVTGAGISAGTNIAASVDAANRAAAAAGGSPSALMAYRARAGRQIGQQAGDAMTQARVAASNAAAQRAEDIGQTRIGQQNQALGYYNQLQQQQNANAQNAANRQEQASQLGLQASQTPSTFDKVMGGVGAAVGALEKGHVSSGAKPAVIGENGPEKVVSLPGKTDYLDDGDVITGDPLPQAPAYQPGVNAPQDPSTSQPFWKQLIGNLENRNRNQGQAQSQSLNRGAPGQPGVGGGQANDAVTNDINSFGQGIGKLASAIPGLASLADGGIMSDPSAGSIGNFNTAPQGANGVFTKPTRVNLHKNEAVVPLSYRAGAKVRPSMAALPAARPRQPYGGMHGV
jgi:hypothetical protein